MFDETVSRIVGGYVYEIRISRLGYLCELYRQPIDPTTGKPWRTAQRVERFDGHNAMLRAQWALAKLAG